MTYGVLRIKQGETWQETIPVTPATAEQLTGGFTARAQVREAVASDVVLYEWSDENGNLSIAGDGSAIVLDVTAATSLAWPWRRGVWALELTDSVTGAKTCLLEDWFYVYPAVVR